MARFSANAVVALALLAPAVASGACEMQTQVVSSSAGPGLQIDASVCTDGLEAFWRQMQSRISPAGAAKLRWISVVGPVGPDHQAALSSAWSAACNSRGGQTAAFLRAYSRTSASRVLAPSLAALRPVPDSVDNFYPLKPSKAHPGISAPNCKLELLPPVIYYRLQAPNNSSKPTPLRGAA